MRSHVVRLSGATLICCALVSAVSPTAAAEIPVKAFLTEAEYVDLGRELFERDWKAAGPALKGADGLGPVHNAVSCVACHRQKGVGGAGPNDNNVSLISMVPPTGKRVTAPNEAFRKNAAKLHRGFADSTNLILHAAHATDPDYPHWRTDLLAKIDSPQMAAGKPLPGLGVLSLKHSQRSTPALFGAGLINQLPDSVLLAAEKQQKVLHPHLSGRVGRTPQGAVARYGWRGQTAWLRDFVLGACANELGLQVPGKMELRDPKRPNDLARTPDLAEQHCDALVMYVASLPAPKEVMPAEEAQAAEAREGRLIFDRIGCAACHMPTLGHIEGIYSDLLLHAMGPALADPVAAIPEAAARQPCNNCGYFGGSGFVRMIATAVEREWRTPPLWGVADSAPYMHDGRAATLDDAIHLHLGEGLPSSTLYAALPVADRDKLLAFLGTLAGPPEAVKVAGK